MKNLDLTLVFPPESLSDIIGRHGNIEPGLIPAYRIPVRALVSDMTAESADDTLDRLLNNIAHLELTDEQVHRVKYLQGWLEQTVASANSLRDQLHAVSMRRYQEAAESQFRQLVDQLQTTITQWVVSYDVDKREEPITPEQFSAFTAALRLELNGWQQIVRSKKKLLDECHERSWGNAQMRRLDTIQLTINAISHEILGWLEEDTPESRENVK